VTEFNLIDEPWIPCIALNGKSAEFGIRDALLKAHELREICDDSPLVTVAIHRLLLAILYRVHGGPEDYATWKRIYASGVFDRSAGTTYLERWKSRFDLRATRPSV